MRRMIFSLAVALALWPVRSGSAQSGNGTAPFPPDAALGSLVEIWVGTELRGTGILMDDEALTVVTASETIEGGGILGITVRVNGEGFSRKADIIARERNYGLTLLRPVGTPETSARTDRFASPPAEGTSLTLAGCYCVLRNMYGICQETGIGYGNVTVLRPESGVLPHPYRPPTKGLMIIALPMRSPVPLTGGMGVFSPTDGRLIGIVVKAYDDQLLVVPTSTITAMLDGVVSALKRK